MNGLTEGRIVHYVMPNGVHRPAVVVHVWDRAKGTANLTVFTDPAIDGENLRFAVQVEHSEWPGTNTWHWIEKT